MATDKRLQLSHPVAIAFDVAGLDYGEQLELWQAAWCDREPQFDEHLQRFAAQFRLSAAMIQTASAAVQSDSELSSEQLSPEEIGDRLWDFCRLQARPQLEGLAQRIDVRTTWAILTTNLKDNLDPAFMRRLRFIVNFPDPKAPQRNEIWQRAFPKDTPTKGLNYKRLGQLDVTGGNIKSIALNAAFLAALRATL